MVVTIVAADVVVVVTIVVVEYYYAVVVVCSSSGSRLQLVVAAAWQRGQSVGLSALSPLHCLQSHSPLPLHQPHHHLTSFVNSAFLSFPYMDMDLYFFSVRYFTLSSIQNCNIYKFGMDNGHNLSTLLLRMRSTMLIQDIINWAMSTVSLKLSDGVPLHRPAQLSTPPPHMEHSVRALCRAPLSAV